MNSMQDNPYQTFGAEGQFAAFAEENERAGFIRRTYLHLAAAVLAFIAIEAVVFTFVPEETLAGMWQWIAATRFGWLLVLGWFVGVSWIAQSWATSTTSLSTQYLGLGLYVAAQAAIFVPLLYVAGKFEGVISAAAVITGIIFCGLTLMVFVTKVDLSWLGKFLWLAMLGALGVIVCSMIFQFSLGVLFTGALIVLASAYILYDTSNVMHHYRTDQYVAAALALFASVALLFWYVLQFVMQMNRR